MSKKEWEYYSLHWIECSQQWQITQDQTNNDGTACHWDYLDDACEDSRIILALCFCLFFDVLDIFLVCSLLFTIIENRTAKKTR